VPEPLPQTAEAESAGEDAQANDAEESGEGLAEASIAYWLCPVIHSARINQLC
jgi:hypothetical protein